MNSSDKVLTELICFLENKLSEVKNQIGAQEEAEMDRAEGLHVQLDKDLTELRHGKTEIEKLLNTDDQVYFLKVMKWFCI